MAYGGMTVTDCNCHKTVISTPRAKSKFPQNTSTLFYYLLSTPSLSRSLNLTIPTIRVPAINNIAASYQKYIRYISLPQIHSISSSFTTILPRHSTIMTFVTPASTELRYHKDSGKVHAITADGTPEIPHVVPHHDNHVARAEGGTHTTAAQVLNVFQPKTSMNSNSPGMSCFPRCFVGS